MMNFQEPGKKSPGGWDMSIYEKLHDGAATSEVAGEFTLPDYLPPVKKMVRVFAKPRLNGKYMNGEAVEYEGEVSFETLYISEENTVESFAASLPFTQSCPVHNLDENCIVWVTPELSNVACRLTGPRKMNLRAVCDATVTAVTPHNVAPAVTASGNEVDEEMLGTLQSLPLPVSVCDFFYAEDPAVRCSEDIECENVISRIVSTDCRAILSDAKVADGKLNYRTDVYFTILCRAGTESETPYFSIQKHFPISRTVEAENIPNDANVWGECEMKDTALQIGTDRMGEEKRIEADWVLNTNFTVCCNRKAKTLRDAYSTAYPTTVQNQNCRSLKHRKTDWVNFTVSGMIPQNGLSNATVIDARGEAENITMKADKNKLTVAGDANLTFLVATGDENEPYQSLDGTVPFQYECPSDGFMGDYDRRVDCMITDIRGRADGGSIRCDLEVILCFHILEKVNVPYLSEIEMDAENPCSGEAEESMLVYYPRSGESLWDIAKKYRVPLSAVREANGIPPERECAAEGDRILAIERK